MSTPARFFKNSRGNLQLIDPSGYTFVRHTGKSGPEQRVYYRCSEYKKGCKTWAVVKNNQIINLPILHDHLLSSNIDAKLAELWAADQAQELTTKPKEIWEILNNLPFSVRDDLASKKCIMKRIYYRRQKVKKEAEEDKS
jgi:hypothetical protein